MPNARHTLVPARRIPVPGLPAAMAGLRVLHVTDLHAGRTPSLPARIDRLGSALAALPADRRPELIAFTGDAGDSPRHNDAAIDALARLGGAIRQAFDGMSPSALGVFGNHDDASLQARAIEASGDHGIRWLRNERAVIDLAGRGPIEVLGVSHPEDVLSAAIAPAMTPTSDENGSNTPFRILLAHFPTQVYPAAAVGVPLVLAGHTHGGQIRLSPSNAPHTSCDLPSHLASGCLALGRTRCCIARGLGEAVVPVRVNCPPEAPIYELTPADDTDGGPATLTQLIPW